MESFILVSQSAQFLHYAALLNVVNSHACIAIYSYCVKPAVKDTVLADVKYPNSVSGFLAISSHTPITFRPLLNCPHSAIDRKIV